MHFRKVQLGKAFFDSVSQKKNQLRFRLSHWRGWGARLTLIYVLLVGSFFILVIRLFHLTIISGTKYRQLSEGNRIYQAVIHAPRGIFYDRTNKALVVNLPA